MWVEFGNKFHEVCDEFHERSEWNSRKRVKFISEFHEQGVDSYIITWITKNEKFTLFTWNYWIWETFLRSYAWDRGDLRNFPPRSNISPKLRNSLEKWRMGLRLTPKIFFDFDELWCHWGKDNLSCMLLSKLLWFPGWTVFSKQPKFVHVFANILGNIGPILFR